jgi:hypothetical protein
MTIVQDITNLPNKIADGFVNTGKKVAQTGERIATNITEFGELAFDKTSSFAKDMGSKIADIGGQGLSLAGDVADKVKEGGKYMIDEGIPFIKRTAPKVVSAGKATMWLFLVIFIVVFCKLLGIIVQNSPIRKGVSSPILYAVMCILAVGIVFLAYKLYTFQNTFL